MGAIHKVPLDFVHQVQAAHAAQASGNPQEFLSDRLQEQNAYTLMETNEDYTALRYTTKLIRYSRSSDIPPDIPPVTAPSIRRRVTHVANQNLGILSRVRYSHYIFRALES